MQNVQVQSVSLRCTLSDLIAVSAIARAAETIFSQNEPLSLSVYVEFVGSGAIALLPLKPALQVDFFAKCVEPGEELDLGSAILETAPRQLRYQPTLSLGTGLATVGCLPEKIYKISALLRVGCPHYPALVSGVIEGLMIQTYNQ